MRSNRIGFIGLGIMGKPTAKNLVDAGYDVVVNDVRDDPVAELEDHGAESRETPAEVAEVSDTIITFLPKGEHVRKVALGDDGIVEGADEGQVLIDMSTIGPGMIREVADALADEGIRTIDAPVSGSEQGAREAWMRIMIGGDEHLVEEYREMFEVIGGQVTRVGDTGAGQVAKVCNNMIAAAEVASLSEALVFAEKAGISQEKLVEAIEGGAAQTWALETRAEGMIDGDLEPGFFGSYMYKDLSIAVDDGEEYGAPIPLSSINHELFKSLEEKGRGELDFSAVVTVYEDMAGLDE
ncbi:NAD(P)-dependent oxidoreductase [Natrialbaceae archaeon AArc-T1-2]|uniref:NAD(P)-dependent oxidoreductase n=1 Tax=Natrialbaceae archaeon AArc-T1-2 TaxID=3053904 RepID=UPI00255B1E3C|nr:NAD(P)-binding domain-containing protein [Natrialbaceae archaeon AArc-T1-2]WIV68175.1 NAD(P)-binding domain-containing protein [Natrialbaceae archaeon AArc-T1-2]